jgi:GT2 family glycosyltransferase
MLSRPERPVEPIAPPVNLLEVELAEPVPSIPPGLAPGGTTYMRARVLVRLHGIPLGMLDLDLSANGVSAKEHATAIWGTLRNEIAAHLHSDDLEAPVQLPVAGLRGPRVPHCARRRDELLRNAPCVTIVIPTIGRFDALHRCLGSIVACCYPADRVDVVVVINGEEQAVSGPAMLDGGIETLVLRTARRGASHARNIGARAATGDVVAFVDDDVVVDRLWLSALVAPFLSDERCVCVTGAILPLELETPAQVLIEEFGGFVRSSVARRTFDLDRNRPSDPLFPYTVGAYGSGANMAFRRDAFTKLGGFDERLGPGTPTLSGEDPELLLRTVLSGGRLVYEGGAIVRHAHTSEYEVLCEQMFAYGVGFSALITRTIVEQPRLVLDLCRKLPRGVAFALSTGSSKNARKSRAYPRQLTRLELRGLVRGPFAFLDSSRHLRRKRI